MSTHRVSFVGLMHIGDPVVPEPPLTIWGPGDPRPTPPIAGWNPSTGTWPTPPPVGPGPGPQPPGIWGPPGPWPSPPIQLPPWVGQPQPPFPWTPPSQSGPAVPTHPVAGMPGPGGAFVAYYVPGYGWMLAPASGAWGSNLPTPGTPPPTEPPPATTEPAPPTP